MKNQKLTILIATAFPTHGAGSGALVTTQAKSYVEDGHNVVIITGNNRTDFDKIEGVKYHIVPFTSEGESPEKIKGQVGFNYLMFTTHTESTANFWNVKLDELEQYCKAFKKALLEEIEKSKPDVIHAQHNWLLSSEATRMGIPVVTTIHGTDLMGYEKSKTYLEEVEKQIADFRQNKIFLSLEPIFNNNSLSYKEITERTRDVVEDLKSQEDKKSAKLAVELLSNQRKYKFYINEAQNSAKNSCKIIVISEAQKEKFIKLFPNEVEKVELIENGYDPKTFYVDKEVDKDEVFAELQSNITEDGRIPTDFSDLILFVGKFADFKGIDSILTANKLYDEELRKQGKNPLTIIVGSGSLEEKLKKQAKELGLDNTHFVGRKGHDVIRKLQNLATVSLIPSRNEPFGLVVIEGTACGHPVIGSNSGGIPDIMNVYKKELPNEDIIKTPLGILIRPLPERPSIKDEEKEIIDSKTPEYVIGDDETRHNIVSYLSNILPVSEKTLRIYLDEYTLSTKALAGAVTGICNKKLVFDNEKIATYTEEVYSQPRIREKLIDLFKNAIDTFRKKNNDKTERN